MPELPTPEKLAKKWHKELAGLIPGVEMESGLVAMIRADRAQIAEIVKGMRDNHLYSHGYWEGWDRFADALLLHFEG